MSGGVFNTRTKNTLVVFLLEMLVPRYGSHDGDLAYPGTLRETGKVDVALDQQKL